MQDSGSDHPVRSGKQAKSRKSPIVPILSIIVGFAVLVWWLGSWLIVESMSWAMCFGIMLPGMGGGLLVFYGIVALIKRAIPDDPEAE